jgi:hypothetical protein
MLHVCIIYLESVFKHKLVIFYSIIPMPYICVRNDLRIRGYLLKQKVVRVQKISGHEALDHYQYWSSGVHRNFFRGVWGSRNSVVDRWHRDGDLGGGSLLVRGSTQFAGEWNPYSDKVVTNLFSTELGIRLSFVKTSEFESPPPWYTAVSSTT